MAELVATYRWQLLPEAGFRSAADAAPDLAELGISHVYLSPIAEAVPRSAHGYDVTDPTRLRAELGGEEGFQALVDACRAHGMGLVVDIVPNHLAAHEANPWWWDVLRLGRASRHASLFDIDWSATDQLLLPILGDHYGRELEAGTLRLERGEGPGRVLVVRYHDRRFPLRPEATGAILAEAARRSGDAVLGVAARVLARVEEQVHPDEREADLAVAELTVLARLGEKATAAAVDAELARLHDDADALDLVLSRQHHRLARWTIGDAEVEYRRFFDVDALVATRMSHPETFDQLHTLVPELLATGVVDGLRVDHVDGLADPAGYLARLRDLAGERTWLVVEKILEPPEELPDWPVAGTTGYEVADLLGAWLTDPAGATVLEDAWREWTGEQRTYAEVAEAARREALASRFAADVDRVADALQRVCDGRRRHRDHARAALRAAVAEVAVHLPVYRTYVSFTGGDVEVRDVDRTLLAGAVGAAKQRAPELDPELLDLLEAVLTGALRGTAEEQVTMRFQQLTGPVAAKGQEDTALYRWLPLPHRCEVGADPSRVTATAAEWHAACADAQARWPRRMTTISTHDTKRSADARARLAALTTAPALVLGGLERWWDALRPGRGDLPMDQWWLVFHVLVAGWPMEGDRAMAVIEKSAREGGVHTSWTHPDEVHEARLRDLVAAAVADPVARAAVASAVQATADAADAGALAQLLAQLLAPGIPDVYQGGEGWDHALVDPDNRRPPDRARRGHLVRQASATTLAAAWTDHEARRSGLPRTVLLREALLARRRQPDAVGPGPAGAYTGLPAEGPHAGRVLGFTRGAGPELAVVVVRPGPPVDATVVLPGGSWVNRCTGAEQDGGRVSVAELLGDAPVALLER